MNDDKLNTSIQKKLDKHAHIYGLVHTTQIYGDEESSPWCFGEYSNDIEASTGEKLKLWRRYAKDCAFSRAELRYIHENLSPAAWDKLGLKVASFEEYDVWYRDDESVPPTLRGRRRRVVNTDKLGHLFFEGGGCCHPSIIQVMPTPPKPKFEPYAVWYRDDDDINPDCRGKKYRILREGPVFLYYMDEDGDECGCRESEVTRTPPTPKFEPYAAVRRIDGIGENKQLGTVVLVTDNPDSWAVVRDGDREPHSQDCLIPITNPDDALKILRALSGEQGMVERIKEYCEGRISNLEKAPGAYCDYIAAYRCVLQIVDQVAK